MKSIGVLISGRGTNLQALIDSVVEHRLDAKIAVVISNRTDAQGLDRARSAGIETLVIGHRSFPTRDGFDAAVAAALRERGVSLVRNARFSPPGAARIPRVEGRFVRDAAARVQAFDAGSVEKASPEIVELVRAVAAART